MFKIIKLLSEYLGFTERMLLNIENKAPYCYREYMIPKKSGGKRLISQPTDEVKAVQYALTDLIFNKLPIHKRAMAYQVGRNSPIQENARQHVDFPYSLRLDFEDFFNSILPEDLSCVIKNDKIFNESGFTKDDLNFISRICFRRKNHQQLGLAIGAPSSPAISNVVMFRIDENINKKIKSWRHRCIYTRYSDDIVYSSAKKGDCDDFYSFFKNYIESVDNPNLKINESKTAFMSRGTKRKITGLIITPDGNISIGRKQKKYIKKLVNDFRYGILNEDKINYLSGYLAYILDVEPDFYNRLVVKYTSELLEKALHYSETEKT